MRRIVFGLIVVLALAAFAAGQGTNPASNAGPYVVQQGDNLWTLSGVHRGDSVKWGELIGLNPFLKEPGRQFVKPDGTIVVLIRPGEALRGLTDLGITAEPLPISELKPPAEATAPAPATLDFSTNQPIVPGWVRWLILLALLAVGSYALARLLQARGERKGMEQSERELRETRERELRQDPVTSGPPIVAGGVQPNETDRIARTLEAAAVADYVRLNPNVDRQTVRVERIGPVEAGTISGEGMVGYADRARPRLIDPPQPGYRAMFRFPDGREDLLMSLQGCMNPCFYGEGLSGFVFTPRQTVVSTPVPPTPAPQALPHPAIAVARIRAAAGDEGRSTLTIGDRVMVFDRGVHLTVDEATGAVTVNAAAFEMTVRPRRARRTVSGTAPRVVASGTTGDSGE